MMSNYYNDFFRNHERLFRDFESDFGREIIPSLPGMLNTFHQELPMLSWTDDDFFLPIEQGMSGDREIDSGLRDLNSKFEEDYKKLRQNYEKQLLQIHDKRSQLGKGLQQSPAEGPAHQQHLPAEGQAHQQHQQHKQHQLHQQHQQHPATGSAGKMDVESDKIQQQPRRMNDAYEYYFTSTRQLKDGKETGETIEKKEKIVDGKKELETKITKYNPDGTKDVQRIIEDENGKKETKLRLDNKNQPLQLE